MKTSLKLYIHQKPGEPQQALTCDMSQWPASYGALLGSVVVEVEWQEIAKNPTAELIAYWEQQMDNEFEEHTARIVSICGHINDLRFLEHKEDAE